MAKPKNRIIFKWVHSIVHYSNSEFTADQIFSKVSDNTIEKTIFIEGTSEGLEQADTSMSNYTTFKRLQEFFKEFLKLKIN